MSLPKGAPLAAAILQQAVNSLGHCYVFGGAPGPGGSQCWDCSSCANYNIGAVNGQAIPGFPPGTYDGSSHGPSTLGWLGWIGQGVSSISRSQAQAADIACWQTHMGICISNQEMISAANPADGTIQSGIDGFIPGETLFILRLKAIGAGGFALPIPQIGGTQQINAITKAIAQEVVIDVRRRNELQRIATRGWR